MKKVCLAFGFVVAMAGFLTHCSSDRVEQNVQNSQRLKVGMLMEEALDIMGEPYEIKEHVQDKGVFDYYYESPFGASDWIFFTVNPVKRVVDVTPYPELPAAFEPAIADLGGGYRMRFSDISNG